MNEFKLKLKPEEITLLNITKEISWRSAHVGLPDAIEVTSEQYSAIADLFVDGKPTKLEGIPIKIIGSKPDNLFNKYFSKCGLIGELPEKISTLAPELTLEMMQDAWDKTNKILDEFTEWGNWYPLNPTLSNIKTTSFKTYDWEQFWCKASWLVIGITLGLVVAMILI